MLYRKVVLLSYLFSINSKETTFKYLYLEASVFQPWWRHEKGSNYLFASNAYSNDKSFISINIWGKFTVHPLKEI